MSGLRQSYGYGAGGLAGLLQIDPHRVRYISHHAQQAKPTYYSWTSDWQREREKMA